MSAIVFETWIVERMARHAAEEAERTAPVSVAYQALTDLRESLGQLCFRDRDEITEELRALVRELDESRWQPFGAVLAHQH
jgi:hypothetical protein